MTRFVQSLSEVLDSFDVAVLDQWGVLHNGSVPYPNAAEAITMLREQSKHLVILSNSGKRAAANLKRIAHMGLPTKHIADVVTSGEALREDLLNRRLIIDNKTPHTVFPICGKQDDAEDWLGDATTIRIAHELDEQVDCIMLMGLPDGSSPEVHDAAFTQALDLNIPLICSNPDKTSPRAGGLVVSPGALADRYAKMGGRVVWYGKPYQPVYDAVKRCRPDVLMARFLMIGDSLEHDIAGAQQAGFSTAWVRGGIHADAFGASVDKDHVASITQQLVEEKRVSPPDFSLQFFA
ncbi:MAG: TIGR01459 family HAD-type hydrolase [Planctomycetota bacterium]